MFWSKNKEVVEEPEFVPRTWAFPRDKVVDLLKVRDAYYASPNNYTMFTYYTALADAGFDGFGHGSWIFRFSLSNGLHNKCFPCPYLEELDPEDLENEE